MTNKQNSIPDAPEAPDGLGVAEATAWYSGWENGYEEALAAPVLNGWKFRDAGDGVIIVSREIGPDETSTGVFHKDRASVPWEFIHSLVESLAKFHNTELAAMLIYKASGYEINPRQFYLGNTQALEDMKRLAEDNGSAA